MSEQVQRIFDKLNAAGSVDKLKSAARRLASRAPNYQKWFNQFPRLNSADSKLSLLGKTYTQAQKGLFQLQQLKICYLAHILDEFCLDLSSRIWLSYRDNFAPLDSEGKIKSDVGWSCMLRAAQMLVAQALMASRLGRGTFNILHRV